MMDERTRTDGFTLVELLVVLALIAVLTALAYPVYQRVVQNGRATACVSNLRQIGVGLGAYLADNNNVMPTLNTARASISVNVPVIDNTLSRYITNPSVFACPADVNGFAQSTGTSYFWNVAINGQSLANLNFLPLLQGSQNTQSPSQIPMIADKEGFHPYLANKVNVLYADGHATKDLSFFTGN
jgi:prepilin-type N-terminal cleavage/methylation domain-containing protein/prepilin-type processing-associated H-X9-DG protein